MTQHTTEISKYGSLRRQLSLVVAVVAAAAMCPALLTGASAAAGMHTLAVGHAAWSGTWGTAQQVPGAAALNQGGNAGIESVSCGAAGNCSAGGYYTDGSGHMQVFVAAETKGTWRTALEIPGTAALNQGGSATISSVSCASAGNCSAAGSYTDSSGHRQALVVRETNGTWGSAEEVPGTAALSQGGYAEANSVSCASAGNCSAGGYYQVSGHAQQAFVVGEKHGTWSTAEEVPGITALASAISSVSCASAGNCSAAGFFINSSGYWAPFVLGEDHGTWGTAEEVPGIAALNHGSAFIGSMSCASAGNCSAGSSYVDSSGDQQVFVDSEVRGTWGAAEEVPGTAAFNQGGSAAISSLSCGSAGNCSAAGSYIDSSGDQQVFVDSEVRGTWGTAEQVPGTAALNQDGLASIASVSCASPYGCSAGGQYADASFNLQAFVVSRRSERPHTARLAASPRTG